MSVLATSAKSPDKKGYALDQCALFKVGSKRRLSELLFFETKALVGLAAIGDENYKKFSLKAVDDPFSKPRKRRDVQEPKPELRRVHDRIQLLLRRIVPPNYLHSAVKKRSYRTNAGAHLNQPRLLKVDIRKFYPTTTESRVYSFFSDVMLCAPDVARLLARLCTWNGVLATGSPLSPILSYFVNKPMFDELSVLAKLRELIFTCYVDDLAFSGVKVSRGLEQEVEVIVRRHGHSIAKDKTRFYRRGSPKLVTGIVIKGGAISVPHERFKRMRALRAAIRTQRDPHRRLALAEKFNGLVGEASQIEPKFRIWSDGFRSNLAKYRSAVPKK